MCKERNKKTEGSYIESSCVFCLCILCFYGGPNEPTEITDMFCIVSLAK